MDLPKWYAAHCYKFHNPARCTLSIFLLKSSPIAMRCLISHLWCFEPFLFSLLFQSPAPTSPKSVALLILSLLQLIPPISDAPWFPLLLHKVPTPSSRLLWYAMVQMPQSILHWPQNSTFPSIDSKTEVVIAIDIMNYSSLQNAICWCFQVLQPVIPHIPDILLCSCTMIAQDAWHRILLL